MRIRLPALTFSRTGIVWPIRDPHPLTQASERRIQRGDFEGMTIIDALGELFAVTGLERRGYAPPFWGFRLFTPRLKRIELQLRSEGTIEIEEIRARVWRGVLKQRAFWESAWDLGELESELQARESVAAIVELMLSGGRDTD